MRVLITRPADEAERLARTLHARGHETLIAPLMQVHLHDGPEVPLDGVQAILATSANGVRALARRTARRDVPVFAVGPQTAAAARAHGFAQVRSADGDARRLAASASDWADPARGRLLHVRGSESPPALETLLLDQGFEVRGAVLYDVAAAEVLPAELETELRLGHLDAALYFSPRSARIFRELAASLDVGGMLAVCISDATRAQLVPLAFREIRIAEQPNQKAMLAALER